MKHLNIALECDCETAELSDQDEALAGQSFDGTKETTELADLQVAADKLDAVGDSLADGMSKAKYDQTIEMVPALESLMDRSELSTQPGLMGLSVALEAVNDEKVSVARRAIAKIVEYVKRFAAWVGERMRALRDLAKRVMAASTKTVHDTIQRCESVLKSPNSVTGALRSFITREKNKSTTETRVNASVEKFVKTVQDVADKINGNETVLYVYHSANSVTAQFDNLESKKSKVKDMADRISGLCFILNSALSAKGDLLNEASRYEEAIGTVESSIYSPEEIAKMTVRTDVYAERHVKPRDIRMAEFLSSTIKIVKDYSSLKQLDGVVDPLNKVADIAQGKLDDLAEKIHQSSRTDREKHMLSMIVRRASNAMSNVLSNTVSLASSCATMYGAVMTLQIYGSSTILKAGKLMVREVTEAFEDPEARKGAKLAMEKMLAVAFEENQGASK